jgi:hypothetical protein
MLPEWLTVMTGPVQQLVAGILGKLSAIVLALLLLLVGMVVARGLRAGVEKFLAFLHLDEYTEKIKLNELFARLGFGRSPAFILGFLIYWLIILVFLVSAADVVQLSVVSELLQKFVLFVPRLIGAVLVLAGGLLAGHFLGEIVLNATTANKIQGAMALSKVVQFVVVVFAAIMALDQIGIDTSILTSSIQIILAAVGLGFAIAFGLGGRDVAADIIRNFASKRAGGGN